MEIIIGRDATTSQLRLSIAGGKSCLVGAVGSVPASVSRQHCAVSQEADGTLRLRNLNARNTTFVNNLPIETKAVTTDDTVELGADHYLLEWAPVEMMLPRTADIRPLKEVWQKYNDDVLRLTVRQNRFNALKSGMGIITLSAVVLGVVFGRELSGPFIVPYVLAIVLSLFFFFKSWKDSAEVPRQRQQLTDQFRSDYACPHCRHYLAQPYDQLELLEQCPHCKTPFRK